MIRRSLIAATVALAAGMIAPAHAQCIETTDVHHVELATGIVIHATETTPTLCTAQVTRTIEIRQGENVCTGTPADVVTDPFGFGGGPRSLESEVCGANYSLNVAFEPLLPVPDSIVVDPDDPSVGLEARKNVTVQGGSYTTPWDNGTIGTGTPGYVGRIVIVVL